MAAIVGDNIGVICKVKDRAADAALLFLYLIKEMRLRCNNRNPEVFHELKIFGDFFRARSFKITFCFGWDATKPMCAKAVNAVHLTFRLRRNFPDLGLVYG